MIIAILLISALFFAAFAVIIVGGSLWRTPQKCYAVPSVFGKRKPRVRREGLGAWWPKPIGDMEFISLEPRSVEVPVTFQVTDEVEMTSAVTVPYAPDPNCCDPDTGVNRFSLVAAKEISDLQPYLKRFVEEKFGGLGGKISAEDAVQKMESTSAYINVTLRISKDKAPHLNHAFPCGTAGCDIPETKVSAKNLMNFYSLHWREVSEALDMEESDTEDTSSVEKEWGINIGRVSYSQPRFAPHVQRARDAKKEAAERVKAVREEIVLAKEARDVLTLEAADAATFVREGTRQDVKISSMHFMGNPPPGLVNLNPTEKWGGGGSQEGAGDAAAGSGERAGKQKRGGK